MTYVIKHVLPNGEVAGYHADSCCTIVKTAERAKRCSGTSEAAKWLKTVRHNFEFAWSDKSNDIGGGSRYRNFACWKGHSLEQIRTELEVVFET